jgi:predicted metalloprotease with PDZ domain
MEIGHFQTITIRKRDPRILAVIHGDSWKPAQIIDPLQKICSYEMRLMGGAPFDEYTFIYHIGSAAAGSGGMEHANSTAISLASGQDLPGVSAHEFFHLWNVKRIRPQSLEPVDYTQEMWTRSLWFAEGVTSTYAAYTLLRTGIWTKDTFYRELGGQITELELRPASHWKSVEEASLDAWLEKYPLHNLPALSISYYNKGQILGVLLDVLIRDATNNRKSLDDMMRALNEEFAKKTKSYKDVDLRLIAEKMAGRKLEEFFARYVSGSDELPYQDMFSRAGLTLTTAQHEAATFGFWPKHSATDGVTVSALDPEEPAARAGLREGDVLLALNGAAFPTRSERWLREHAPREIVKVRFRRGTEEKEVRFALAGHIQRTDQIEELPHPTEKQLSIREGILRGITEDSAWQ